jgi:hypothetical protein
VGAELSTHRLELRPTTTEYPQRGVLSASAALGDGRHDFEERLSGAAIILFPQWANSLAHAGQYLGAVAVVYYGIKAVIMLLATVVGIFTKNEKRGERFVQIVQAVSRGRPSPPRLPPRARDD